MAGYRDFCIQSPILAIEDPKKEQPIDYSSTCKKGLFPMVITYTQVHQDAADIIGELLGEPLEEQSTSPLFGVSEYEFYWFVDRLRALADPTRLRILSLLYQYNGITRRGQLSGDELLCGEELVARCAPLKQPTISHHISILRRAGLISTRKRGLYSYHFVNDERVREVQNGLVLLKKRPMPKDTR